MYLLSRFVIYRVVKCHCLSLTVMFCISPVRVYFLPELKLILSSIVVATEDCFVLSDYDMCNSISIPRDGIPLFII